MASVVVNGDTSGAVTLSAPAVAGTVTVTLPDASGTMLTSVSPGYNGFKNRIINGAMVIDQRNAGASVTASVTAAQTYTIDRWAYQASQASKFTIQQNAASVTPPAGFKNYLGVTVGASANVTVGSSDYFLIDQIIEGYNIADFGFGAAGASTITLSFWVRSSVTGTFGGSLLNGGASRSYPFTYSIPTANTWTQISVTIAGDTSGTWLSTNGQGIFVSFSLGMGSTFSGTASAWAGSAYYSATGAVSPITTNSATFYITGVQLEKGSTATSFDYRPYTTELQLCQRYYQLAGMGGSYLNSTGSQQARFMGTPCVTPRASPTFTLVSSNVVGNVAAANPTSYNSGATTHLQVQSSAGSGAYTDANYTYSLSAEL